MPTARELNLRIATEVFGYKIKRSKGIVFESHPTGDRPLKNYCQELNSAFEVAQHMKITLIPVIGEQWFAFIGGVNIQGWDTPQAMLKFLDAGEFSRAGAVVDVNPAVAICKAAVNYLELRRKDELKTAEKVLTEIAPDENSAIH